MKDKITMKRDANGYKLHKSGKKTWKNSSGQYHRLDGPAIEHADGEKHWNFNGMLHRVDGPAVEWANGNKYWYFNGMLHRVGGPAVEYANGKKEYWYKGELISEEIYLSDEFQVKMILEG